MDVTPWGMPSRAKFGLALALVDQNADLLRNTKFSPGAWPSLAPCLLSLSERPGPSRLPRWAVYDRP